MKHLLCVLAVLLISPAAKADIGDTWFQALKKGKAGAAAKITVKAGLKYGADGKNEVIADKIDKHYKRVFTRKFRAMYKPPKKDGEPGAEFQAGTCTSVGRELGYMAIEWREKDPELSEWIRQIPEAFCTGTDLRPPKLWLIKVLGGELPHAIVLFQVGVEDLITGFYHF